MTDRQKNLLALIALIILLAIGLIAWGLIPAVVGFQESVYR